MLYEEILKSHPGHSEALHQLGIIAGRGRNFEKTVELIGRAIDADPGNAAAHNDRGVAFKELKQWDAALASYERAIALRPDYAEAHNNRGNVCRELGQWDLALSSYDRAIALKPQYAEAHNNRGVVLNDLHDWSAALASFDRAIAAKPQYANACCNRGVTLERLGRPQEALADYDRAIAIDENFVQAYVNRGNLLREFQQVDAALANCNRAIAIRSDHAQAHVNKAMALLLAGDWPAGWIEYEWRWKDQRSALIKDRRGFEQPLWLGKESLAGKTVLLHSEQGLGDTLQFCRYVEPVADLGARVILQVQPPVVKVLEGLQRVANVMAAGEPLPAFDYWCPLLSLPLVFGTTVETIPARVPYLRSRPEKRLFWTEKLGAKTKPRVGLVWSGGFRANQPELWALNNRRNIPLAKFASLKHPDIEFYSLQKGQPAQSELADLLAHGWSGPHLIDWTHLLEDFSDTAALIEQMDLVISVDTSTAHLTGALGKPVWILNRFDSCWRWLRERSDSPWYPSARLYRQERYGDWEGVLQRVAHDLAALLR